MHTKATRNIITETFNTRSKSRFPFATEHPLNREGKNNVRTQWLKSRRGESRSGNSEEGRVFSLDVVQGGNTCRSGWTVCRWRVVWRRIVAPWWFDPRCCGRCSWHSLGYPCSLRHCSRSRCSRCWLNRGTSQDSGWGRTTSGQQSMYE